MTPSRDGLDVELSQVVLRNTVLLSLCMALSWSVVQLMAALSAVTLAALTGKPALGGLAPGVSLLSWAAASLLMGRFMDVRGRVPGIRAGFVGGMVGALIIFAGVSTRSAEAFLLGLVLIGAGAGTVNLARAGAADMYPPERRARGISYVLLGAALGAILSPIAFSPLLAGVRHEATGLAVPWLIAMALLGLGAGVTYAIRVDPTVVAGRLRGGPADLGGSTGPPPWSLRSLAQSPAVWVALVAAVVAQAVMNAMMSIIGLIMVQHGHDLAAVALSMSAHFIGMFGLVLMVGQLIDRTGRQRSIVAGTVILSGGVLVLLISPGLAAALPAMFVIGVGWNIAFVASTATLADATRPQERAGLLGFTDFAATSMGAVTSVLSGVVLDLAGLVPLVLVASALALVPAFAMLLRRPALPQPRS